MQFNFDLIKNKCVLIVKYCKIDLVMFKLLNNLFDAYQELENSLTQDINVDEILIIDYEKNRNLLDREFNFTNGDFINCSRYILYGEELRILRNNLENEDGVIYAYIKGNSGLLKTQDINIHILLSHSIIYDNVNKISNDYYVINVYDTELMAKENYNKIINNSINDFLYITYFTITNKTISLYNFLKEYIDKSNNSENNSCKINNTIFEKILEELSKTNIDRKTSNISRF